MRYAFGMFIVLHGLVHLIYFGHSSRMFELRPGMDWPDRSWAFSRLLEEKTTRNLAGILMILAAIGFVVGGVAILAGQSWWRSLVVGAAIFSSVIYILLWDSSTRNIDDQGAIGVFINLAILVAVLAFGWPG